MSSNMIHHHPADASNVCAEVPEFERLSYFFGQMLSAADFRTEQSYFREKMKLHNRCLHGYGIICGLGVRVVPEEECCEPEKEQKRERLRRKLEKCRRRIEAIEEGLESGEERERERLVEELKELQAKEERLRRKLEELDCGMPPRKPKGAKVVVGCGLALDCCGNELILRDDVTVDLWCALSPADKAALADQECGSIYLSICYCAEPTHPTRPVVPDSCGALSDCNYGKYRDSIKFRITTTPPEVDERCEPCCDPCIDECVLLARIPWNGGSLGEPDLSGRRSLTLYQHATISGISWQHGATYSPDEAKDVLGTETPAGRTEGMEVQFSRPVLAETLTSGVVDLWRIQGGSGLSGVISHVAGDYVDKPASGLITSFKYRDQTGETMNSGDRLLVIIRADFILDACCRPLDGNHVGGRVPQLPAYVKNGESEECEEHEPGDEESAEQPCSHPPGQGPWASGNGVGGGSFESWIYID
ncbi:MAG: hypothetical protein QNJ40_06080 [Xanthomonadales bacterium]|nr:hypothetical protein [Xanthomonadales bacterium]